MDKRELFEEREERRQQTEIQLSVLELGRKVTQDESIGVPEYSSKVLKEFVLQWYYGEGFNSVPKRRDIDPAWMYWIKDRYSVWRHLAYYRFCKYNNTVGFEEILRSWKRETLCMFIAIQGDPPEPTISLFYPEGRFNSVLELTMVRRAQDYSRNESEKFVRKYFDLLTTYFVDGNRELHPPNLEIVDAYGLITDGDIFRAFHKLYCQRKAREYLKKHPEKKQEVRERLGL